MNNKITSIAGVIVLGAALAISAKATSNTKHITGDLKTGLALTTSVASSTGVTGETSGNAATDVMMATVTVNEKGIIADCKIDALGVSIGFDGQGVLTTDLASEFQTKQELGYNYNMKPASDIQKEWFEQADAFAYYCIGKTADEIINMPLNDKGKAGDADLIASCTLYPSAFQQVVAKAVENATEPGANADDKLGLGVITSLSKSKDASAEGDGLAQAYVTVAATTVNAEGKITSAVFDAVQANVNFDTTGTITNDITAEVASKNVLQYNYNMKGASNIQKEWFEQADAYAWYVSGKTFDEVMATELNQGAPAEGTDLATSVTIHVTDFNTALKKAVDTAE